MIGVQSFIAALWIFSVVVSPSAWAAEPAQVEGEYRCDECHGLLTVRKLSSNDVQVWLGVGGTPASFTRAGTLGLPLMVAIIGGEPHRFRPLIDRYRQAGLRADHSPDQLKVGIHSLGYVAESSAKAADDFFPGYAQSFSEIGKERGWPPLTRAHYDALLGPTGALLVGDPETVTAKILHVNESLGGISRLTFQMSVAALPHAKLLRAIELLGRRVAPLVRTALASGAAEELLSTNSHCAA